MKKYEIGYALSSIVNKKVASKMQEKIDMDKNKLEQWYNEDGEIASSIVRELAQFLFPTPNVIVLEKDTAGDQYFKVDVILEFPEWVEPSTGDLPEMVHEAYTCAFQIKTHAEQAEIYMEEYKDGVKYKGQVYPCPGVFYCNAKTLSEAITVEGVETLGAFTNAILHPEISKAIDIVNTNFYRVAQREGPYLYLHHRPFQKFFEPWIWDALQRLKILSVGGGRILLNK